MSTVCGADVAGRSTASSRWSPVWSWWRRWSVHVAPVFSAPARPTRSPDDRGASADPTCPTCSKRSAGAGTTNAPALSQVRRAASLSRRGGKIGGENSLQGKPAPPPPNRSFHCIRQVVPMYTPHPWAHTSLQPNQYVQPFCSAHNCAQDGSIEICSLFSHCGLK